MSAPETGPPTDTARQVAEAINKGHFQSTALRFVVGTAPD
jgi:hypothetical protein